MSMGNGRLQFGLVCLTLALGCAAPLPAHAGVDMGGKTASVLFSDAEIDQLLTISGLERSIGAAPGLIRSAVERGLPKLTDEQRMNLTKQTDESRVVALLIETARVDVRSKVDEKSFKEVREWFSGDIAKKIIAAERVASEADGQAQMQDAVAHGASQPLDFDRSQILRDLDWVTRASATQKQTMDDMLDILAKKTKDVAKLTEVQKGILMAQRDMENSMLYAMGSAYKGISDADLKAYVAFYKTQAGQKWVDILRGVTRNLWRLVNQTAMDFLAAQEAARH